MRKVFVAAVAVLALTGCVQADRVGGTVEVERQLEAKAEMYGTSIELERGLHECEQEHPIPVDHAPDHPASEPLAQCVAEVFRTFAGDAK